MLSLHLSQDLLHFAPVFQILDLSDESSHIPSNGSSAEPFKFSAEEIDIPPVDTVKSGKSFDYSLLHLRINRAIVEVEVDIITEAGEVTFLLRHPVSVHRNRSVFLHCYVVAGEIPVYPLHMFSKMRTVYPAVYFEFAFYCHKDMNHLMDKRFDVLMISTEKETADSNLEMHFSMVVGSYVGFAHGDAGIIPSDCNVLWQNIPENLAVQQFVLFF